MSNQSNSKPSILLLAVVAIVSIGAGLLLWNFVFQPKPVTVPEEIARSYIPAGRPVVGIQMTDQDGQPFTEQRFKGKWSFLFFGFTNCPDVCPTTLLVMKSVWNKLPAEAKQTPEPQMVFVSVDPDRDKPEQLKPYVKFYHPEFMAMTGAHDKLDILAVQVGALYGYEDGEKEGEYTVNHSAQVILIDPDGHFRGVFSTPHVVDDIVNGFTAIRQYHEKVKKR